MNMDTEYLKTLTLLFVEADPSIRDSVQRFLESRLGSVVTAANGEEGCAAFLAHPPDLVMTAIDMPGMDGISMAQRMRASGPHVPILMTTGPESRDHLMTSLRLDIEDFLEKPLSGLEMEEALLACARRLRVGQAQRARRCFEEGLVAAHHQATQALLLEGVCHDFNNLVQAILSSVEAACASLDSSDPATRVLGPAREAALQARGLSRLLSAVAYPDDPLDETGPVDPLVRSVVRSLVADTPIRMDFDLQGGELRVRHNPDALGQVLVNLVQNAREAMHDHGTLLVSTRVVETPEGRALHLLVQDSGPGIPAWDLPRVFDPYFTTKPRSSHRGTGLGLPLCRAIVQAHGGSISAESDPGRGTTLHVLLPAARAFEPVGLLVAQAGAPLALPA